MSEVRARDLGQSRDTTRNARCASAMPLLVVEGAEAGEDHYHAVFVRAAAVRGRCDFCTGCYVAGTSMSRDVLPNLGQDLGVAAAGCVEGPDSSEVRNQKPECRMQNCVSPAPASARDSPVFPTGVCCRTRNPEPVLDTTRSMGTRPEPQFFRGVGGPETAPRVASADTARGTTNPATTGTSS